jgi:hypothetical protein
MHSGYESDPECGDNHKSKIFYCSLDLPEKFMDYEIGRIIEGYNWKLGMVVDEIIPDHEAEPLNEEYGILDPHDPERGYYRNTSCIKVLKATVIDIKDAIINDNIIDCNKQQKIEQENIQKRLTEVNEKLKSFGLETFTNIKFYTNDYNPSYIYYNICNDYIYKNNMSITELVNRICQICIRFSSLEKALKQRGVELRKDSVLCYEYINGSNNYSIEQIQTIMCEMKYLYDYCHYKEIIDKLPKPYDREIAKKMALDLYSNGTYPTIFPWEFMGKPITNNCIIS